MSLFQNPKPVSKFGKVAICLSGKIRTGINAYSVFKNFFGYLNADIFFHTWEDEPNLPEVIDLYKPKKYLTTKSKQFQNMVSFGPMLYSIMMANEVKKNYEIEHNFRYDLVIKTRFDLVFLPGHHFPDHALIPRTIYSSGGNQGINPVDFESHGISDLLFWGDSQSMDIATDTYFYYRHHCIPLNRQFKTGHQFDPNDVYFSPGNLIYSHFKKYNIDCFKNVPFISEIPWREDVSELHPIIDYGKIKKRYEQG